MRFLRLTGGVVFAAAVACKSDATTPAGPPSVASVVVIVDSNLIKAPGTLQASVLVRDSLARVLTDRTVTWTTSNNVVALVTSTGLIQSQVQGTAVITATSEGKSGSVTIDVLKADDPVVRIRP